VILYGFSSEGLEFDNHLCNIIFKLSENQKSSSNYCCSKAESKLFSIIYVPLKLFLSMTVTEHLCKAAASSHEWTLGKEMSCAIRRMGNEASMLVVIACCSYIFCCVLCARIIVGCEQLQCKEIIYS